MNQRGQALVETMGFGLVFGGLLVCLLGFTRQFLVRQQLMTAARNAAMLYSSGHFEPTEVIEQTRRFLTTSRPALNDRALDIQVGRCDGFHGLTFQLDRVRLRYHIQDAWVKKLNLATDLEETCVVKHAPAFGLAYQPLYGPPIPWLAGPVVPDS